MTVLQKRLVAAMLAYAGLALFGLFALDNRKMQTVLWIFLGGLAVKTLIAYKIKQQE